MKKSTFFCAIIVMMMIFSLDGFGQEHTEAIIPQTDTSLPCSDYSVSHSGVIRAFGVGNSMDRQLAEHIAHTVALEKLSSKVETTVNTLVKEYFLRIHENLTEEIEKRFSTNPLTVDQTLPRHEIICKELMETSTGKISCYIAIETNEKKVLKPIYRKFQQDAELKNILPDYEEFAQAFNKIMNTLE